MELNVTKFALLVYRKFKELVNRDPYSCVREEALASSTRYWTFASGPWRA